jgi:hypothetical protein
MIDMTPRLRRNLIGVEISEDLLRQMMTTGWRPDEGLECTRGLPRDAAFIASVFRHETLTVLVIYYHPSFPEVPPGEEIPRMTPEYRRC